MTEKAFKVKNGITFSQERVIVGTVSSEIYSSSSVTKNINEADFGSEQAGTAVYSFDWASNQSDSSIGTLSFTVDQTSQSLDYVAYTTILSIASATIVEITFENLFAGGFDVITGEPDGWSPGFEPVVATQQTPGQYPMGYYPRLKLKNVTYSGAGVPGQTTAGRSQQSSYPSIEWTTNLYTVTSSVGNLNTILPASGEILIGSTVFDIADLTIGGQTNNTLTWSSDQNFVNGDEISYYTPASGMSVLTQSGKSVEFSSSDDGWNIDGTKISVKPSFTELGSVSAATTTPISSWYKSFTDGQQVQWPAGSQNGDVIFVDGDQPYIEVGYASQSVPAGASGAFILIYEPINGWSANLLEMFSKINTGSAVSLYYHDQTLYERHMVVELITDNNDAELPLPFDPNNTKMKIWGAPSNGQTSNNWSQTLYAGEPLRFNVTATHTDITLSNSITYPSTLGYLNIGDSSVDTSTITLNQTQALIFPQISASSGDTVGYYTEADAFNFAVRKHDGTTTNFGYSHADGSWQADGASITPAGIQFSFSTSLNTDFPSLGLGKVNLNSESPWTANLIRFDYRDIRGQGLDTWFQAFYASNSAVKGYLYITIPSGDVLIYSINSVNTSQNEGYHSFNVNWIAGGVAPTDGDIVSVIFAPSGNTGANGTSGTNGDWSTAQTIITSTGRILVSSDAGKIIQMTSASAQTVTVNTSTALTAGKRIDIYQSGAGQVTVVASGVTINTPMTLKLRGQHSYATLLCTASNQYVLIGDLAAV